MSQSFQKYQVFLNSTSGARSIGSGKNDENKPKCWKIAKSSYPAYHLCAQNLPNPHYEFPESQLFFEKGNFIYDEVLPVRQEHLQADWNPHQKTGKTTMNAKINPIARLPKAAVSCIIIRIVQGQFHQKLDNTGFPQTPVLTKSEHRKTFNYQSKKGCLKGQKTCRNQTKRVEKATKKLTQHHYAWRNVVFLHATPCDVSFPINSA